MPGSTDRRSKAAGFMSLRVVVCHVNKAWVEILTCFPWPLSVTWSVPGVPATRPEGQTFATHSIAQVGDLGEPSLTKPTQCGRH